MKDIYKPIGSKIREVRKKQKMTLEELADRADLAWSFVASIETGKAIPSIMSLVKLTRALNISMYELFDKTPLPSEDKLLDREIISRIQHFQPHQKRQVIQVLQLVTDLTLHKK